MSIVTPSLGLRNKCYMESTNGHSPLTNLTIKMETTTTRSHEATSYSYKSQKFHKLANDQDGSLTPTIGDKHDQGCY